MITCAYKPLDSCAVVYMQTELTCNVFQKLENIKCLPFGEYQAKSIVETDTKQRAVNQTRLVQSTIHSVQLQNACCLLAKPHDQYRDANEQVYTSSFKNNLGGLLSTTVCTLCAVSVQY